jgi:hypothetical protein
MQPRPRKRLIYVGLTDLVQRYRARFGVCRKEGHSPFWYEEWGIFCYRCHRRVADGWWEISGGGDGATGSG